MSNKPISVVVERKVLPGEEQAFEAYLKEIITACSTFPGYLGTDVIALDNKQAGTNRVVFRFDSMAHLKDWESSDSRKNLIAKIDSVIESPSKLQVLSGLETWFVVHDKQAIMPPPKYKMAVVVWSAITPLLVVFNLIFAPILNQFNLIPRILISSPIIVFIMTYLLMPLFTKIFKSWLYPRL